MLHLPRTKAVTVRHALAQWKASGELTEEHAARLDATIRITPFDWKRLARYAFWAALASVLISVSSLLADKRLLEYLAQFFTLTHARRAAFFGACAAGLFALGIWRRKHYPLARFQNEAVFFLGIAALGTSIGALAQWLEWDNELVHRALLVAVLAYGVLGLALDSALIWVFALLSFGCWMGARTGYASGWGAYYFGFNWPLRYAFLGVGLCGVAMVMEQVTRLRSLWRCTLSTGLFYLFMSLWILSIFGSYTDVDAWARALPVELLHWSALFGLVAVGAIYYGLKRDDYMVRAYGMVFLGINLYTRYFEYFWNHLHKGIFFALLGASLWFAGSRAEALWNRMDTLRHKSVG